MFGWRKEPKSPFVAARPTMGERFAGLAGLSERWGIWRFVLIPWILLTLPFRLIISVTWFIFVQLRGSGVGMQSRRFRHLLEGLPAVIGVVCVCVFAGAVMGRESRLRELYHKAAKDAYMSGEYEQAHLYFERLYELDNGSAETRLFLGLSLDKIDRSEEAMQIISAVAEGEAGGDYRANAWIAAKLLEDEKLRTNPDIRATIYRNLLKAHQGLPQDLEVKLHLANFHLMSGDYRKAIPYLEEAEPANPKVNLELPRFYALDGRRNASRQALERASTYLKKELERKPIDHEIRILLANSYSMQAQFDKALAVLEDGYTLEPRGTFTRPIAAAHLAIYDRLSQAREDELDYTKMLFHLREALRYQPNYVDAISRLVAFGEKSLDEKTEIKKEAKDLLQSMLVRGENSAAVHLVLGVKAWRDNEVNTARSHFEAAYDLDETIPEIANNLAWILIQQEQKMPERALAIIDTVLQRHPESPRYRDTRGEVYIVLEQWDNAIRDLEFVLPTFKNDPRIHESLAKAYDARGDHELAKKHLEEKERLITAQKTKNSEM